IVSKYANGGEFNVSEELKDGSGRMLATIKAEARLIHNGIDYSTRVFDAQGHEMNGQAALKVLPELASREILSARTANSQLKKERARANEEAKRALESRADALNQRDAAEAAQRRAERAINLAALDRLKVSDDPTAAIERGIRLYGLARFDESIAAMSDFL